MNKNKFIDWAKSIPIPTNSILAESCMQKPFLIAQPRNGSEIIALISAGRELDWEVLEAPSSWRLPDNIINSGKVGVPYGSQTFCEVIAQQMSWKLKLNSFDWLALLPFNCVGRKIQFMTMAEAMQLTETKFIKPADDKVFPAKVYKPGELVYNDDIRIPQWDKSLNTLVINDLIPKETPVLVSDVVEFVSEYRCFVSNQKVLTTSCYLIDGEINNSKNWYKSSKEVELFLTNLLDDCIISSESAVIDVGYLSNDNLAIIESNPAWASGIYGCDLSGVLETLKSSCEYGG